MTTYLLKPAEGAALKLTDHGLKLFRPAIEPMFAGGLLPAQFRDPELEHKYKDTSIEALARIAREVDASLMPFVQYSEQAILAGMFGNMAGVVRTGISAAATAQTAIATGNGVAFINAGRTGSVSGNMDQTPNSTAFIHVKTPGTTPNFNTYTAPHAFLLTAAAATSLTIASQSIGLAVSVGDFIFLGGSASAAGDTTGEGPVWSLNAVWIGLSTASGTASQSALLAGEPTSTGGYARIGGASGSTVGGTAAAYGIANNQANFPLPTAASPSVLTSGAAFAFPASSAAWSTGATNLTAMFIADAPTLDGGNIVAAGALGTAQSVNAAGITLSFASGSVTISLT